MARRLVKVAALAAGVWLAVTASPDVWRLMGGDGLSLAEQRTVAWFQGAAVGVCGGFFARELGAALFGGLRLPHRQRARKGRGRR